MSAEKLKLDEVCYKGSSTLMQKSLPIGSGEYPVYGASGLIGEVDFYMQENAYIGIVKDGAGVGRAMLLPAKSSCLGTIQYILPKETIDIRYLFYAIENMRLSKYSTGATIPHIYFKDYKNELIPNISLDEQQAVASKLDSIQRSIKRRQAQLALFDDLVKSQFIEMFGDPIRNTQKRVTTEFINVVKMQRGFDLPVQERVQSGNVLVFGSNGALDRHNVAKVLGGGVITGRSGTIGKVFYTEEDYWPLNTSLFSVDTHGNNIIFLAYLLQLYDLTRFTEGTGVPTLNRNKFHNQQIIDVPLDEQNAFARFVKQTDKSKNVYEMEVAA